MYILSAHLNCISYIYIYIQICISIYNYIYLWQLSNRLDFATTHVYKHPNMIQTNLKRPNKLPKTKKVTSG